MSSRVLYRIFAAIFAGAAVYHMVGATGIAFHNVPPWRHAVWVPINGLMAWAFWLARPWLIAPLAAITAWSFYSHGWLAFLEWRETGHFDWLSLGVIVVLPVMLARAICDARSNRTLAVP